MRSECRVRVCASRQVARPVISFRLNGGLNYSPTTAIDTGLFSFFSWSIDLLIAVGM